MAARIRSWGFGLAALAGTAWLAWSMEAQTSTPAGAVAPAASARPGVSVQDALNRPFDFPFGKPTPLDEVARSIGQTLGAPVALDRAALDRLGIEADDPVQLDLRGVRLKTGLKLLLDQLDLTYRVEAEDNLLVFTDAQGTDDPSRQILAQIKGLHADLHDLQDAVDEIRDAMGLGEEGARMRKPTIIEEVPPGGETKPKDPAPGTTTPPARSRPGL